MSSCVQSDSLFLCRMQIWNVITEKMIQNDADAEWVNTNLDNSDLCSLILSQL